MSATNPLRLVHIAFWTMLRGNTDLIPDLVLPGNCVDFIGSDYIREKDTLQDADTPELRVVAAGLKPHLEQTSSGSELTIRWEVQITSGSRRLETHLDVAWEVWRALLGWQTYLKTLKFADKEFVTLARPLVVETKLGDPRRDRGERGWSAVWAAEVQMDFTTSDLA